MLALNMESQREKEAITVQELMAKNASLECSLAEKISLLLDKDSLLSEKDSAILKLISDIEAVKFQNDQLRRMIFGSKRERFISTVDIHQLSLEFEPQPKLKKLLKLNAKP